MEQFTTICSRHRNLRKKLRVWLKDHYYLFIKRNYGIVIFISSNLSWICKCCISVIIYIFFCFPVFTGFKIKLINLSINYSIFEWNVYNFITLILPTSCVCVSFRGYVHTHVCTCTHNTLQYILKIVKYCPSY